MDRNTYAILGAAALAAVTLACGHDSNAPTSPSAVASGGANTAADGTTLKVTAPTTQSPVNDQRFADYQQTVTLRAGAASPKYALSATLQYRFQLFDAAGTLIQDSGLQNSLTWSLNANNLDNTKRYTWRVRAECEGGFGPWSSTGSFISPSQGYVNDPLTNGTTMGQMVGGHLVMGQGWQADTTNDGLNYDIPTCPSCRVEFDVANFGNGLGNPADLKFLSMGDAGDFGDFASFRNHPWKMHIEQRADGDGTGMKLIWRNGDAGDGDPGDHTGKIESGPDWNENSVYHFIFQWNPSGFSVAIGENGETPEVWFRDGFDDGDPYAPPNHRVSLGCYPRGETMENAIWRNVKIGPQQ